MRSWNVKGPGHEPGVEFCIKLWMFNYFDLPVAVDRSVGEYVWVQLTVSLLMLKGAFDQ